MKFFIIIFTDLNKNQVLMIWNVIHSFGVSFGGSKVLRIVMNKIFLFSK